MITIRPARDDDLPQMYGVFYANEVAGEESSPPPGSVPSEMRHTLHTGTWGVAEQNGQILGYAGAITRGTITFLTDLFVLPALQSAGLGKSLLHFVLPRDGLIHCTVSSSDPRALALYIRSGMQPHFPHFNLRWHRSPQWKPFANDATIVLADDGDLELIRRDAEIGGRERPEDHAFWNNEQQATSLWFLRHGMPVGYGYIREKAGSMWFPEACRIGPLGTRSPDDATDCVLAAANYACQRADVVRIDVPGPHPCLAPLLERGFHIVYVETLVSSAPAPFFNARCYIPSGSDLF